MIGSRLKILLEENNIRQSKLADDLNITRQVMNHYIKNKRNPDYSKLIDIADYFHVSTDYLLSRTTVKDEISKLIENNEVEVQGIAKIPVIAEINNSKDIFAKENIVDYIEVNKNRIDTKDTFYFKVKDDSVSSIASEDSYLLIKRVEELEKGEIGAFMCDNRSKIHVRIYNPIEPIEANFLLLSSLSLDRYSSDMIIDRKERDLMILGKVIRVEKEIVDTYNRYLEMK